MFLQRPYVRVGRRTEEGVVDFGKFKFCVLRQGCVEALLAIGGHVDMWSNEITRARWS